LKSSGLALAILMFVLGARIPAVRAESGVVRLAFEPGVASLSGREEQRSWGALGGFSAALGLGDILWLQVHVDRKIFFDSAPAYEVAAWGAGILYEFDLGAVRPFVEVGLAGVSQMFDARRSPPPQAVPELGAGVTVTLGRWLWLGAVFRYYAFLESDRGTNIGPGYTVANGQIGVRLDVRDRAP
jgi:hypothetical protein